MLNIGRTHQKIRGGRKRSRNRQLRSLQRSNVCVCSEISVGFQIQNGVRSAICKFGKFSFGSSCGLQNISKTGSIMNQGFGLNYTPNFCMVRDSRQVPPGMDCLQLQPHQLRTQPFHYLMNEQAKSLLALQELQNEVGALLEFRDLVMETFPNLRQKMSTSNSHNFSNNQNYCSNTPVQLSASLNSRQWEPGIKVKRKIVNKSDNDGSFGRTRSNSHGSKIHTSQPKSSDAISGVQDSGFSTETNSSNKDHVSSTATSVPLHVHADDPFLARKENPSHKDSRRSDYDRSDEDVSEDGMVMKVNEAEEELWNLLDVIHTKGTKLREEVETLQLRLVVEEIENHIREKELGIRKLESRSNRRCRSLENFSDGASLNFNVIDNDLYHNRDASFEAVFAKKQTRSIEMEDVEHIREERNMLLDKLAEMETENVASRIKNSELQNEISALISTKEELQEQLFQAMKQKNELNSKIHELHLKFVTGERRNKFARKEDKDNLSVMTDSESSQTESSSLTRTKSSDDTHKIVRSVKSDGAERDTYVGRRLYQVNKELGSLDGVVTDPKKLKEYCKIAKPSKEVLKAILKEKNYLELQRHLLISVAENQALNTQLQTSIKSQEDLCEQLDKYKEENDELKFQLEERNIELEGTKAQVRVLERLQQQSKVVAGSRQGEGGKPVESFRFLENEHLKSKGFSETEINRAKEIFMESRNKRVGKSEVLKVLNRSGNENNDSNNNLSVERLTNEVRSNFDMIGKGSNVIPILALPLPELSSNQSSGTESTQALEISSELEADMARADKNESLRSDKSPYRRRPSKIPLNIQKSPKIPLQKSLTKYNPGNALLKKSTNDLSKVKDSGATNANTTFKKNSAGVENGQCSISSRTSRNPNSIRYNSIGRSCSQQSMTSQKSQVSQPRKKCGSTGVLKEDTSLNSNGSVNKTLSLKQTTNFSNIRQRDTLTRKNQIADGVDSGKRTFRRSLRDSFRSKNTSDSSSLRKDSSLSNGRKDSLQQKQIRTVSPTVQPKTNVNKSVITSENDTTKAGENASPSTSTQEGLQAGYQLASESMMVPVKLDSETFCDSLNPEEKPTLRVEKSSIFREVRRNFHRKIAEKITQNLAGYKLISGSKLFQNFQLAVQSSPNFDVWNGPKVEEGGKLEEKDPPRASERPKDELNFFDSIDNSLDIDKDDSLLINSCSYYRESSVQNEAMAELDSLEVDLRNCGKTKREQS